VQPRFNKNRIYMLLSGLIQLLNCSREQLGGGEGIITEEKKYTCSYY
jgi:hypothetical protein